MAHHISEKTQRESFVNCRAYIGAKLESQEQGLKLVSMIMIAWPGKKPAWLELRLHIHHNGR